MKKIFIALIVLFIGTNLFAQDPFNIGLKTGGSIFSFNTKANIDKEALPNFRSYNENTKPGFSFGIFSRIHIWDIISLQPEVYYSKKTSEATIKYVYDAFPFDMTKNTTIHYIDIPILVHVKAVDLPSGNLYAIAGPAISYITKDKYDLSSNFGDISDPNLEVDFENTLKNDFETTNYCIQAGIGYEVSKFNVDLRYESGLSEISKSNFEMKTSSLMLNIGLKFF